MTTNDIILITVIANLLITPFLQYLIASRCSKIKICCMECDRDVITKKEIEKKKDKELEIL